MTTRKISELPEADHPYSGTEAVPLVQEGVTKQVALADLLGDAAVLTWLAPYRVSALASGADNRGAINQAILEAAGRNRPPLVLLPPGRLALDGPVILRRGVRVNGASAADLPVGTELFLANGANTTVVQNDDWPNGDHRWQWAELAYLRVNGNRDGNPDGGSGIAIRNAGEAAQIRCVVAKNCSRFGFEFTGSHAPLVLHGCAVLENGAGGVKLSGQGAALIEALQGEGEGPLLLIEGAGSPSVLLSAAVSSGHEPIVRVKESEPQLVIVGGSVEAPDDRGGNVVKISSGEPQIQIMGLRHFGFERLVRAAQQGAVGEDVAAVGTASGLALYNSAVRPDIDAAQGWPPAATAGAPGTPRIATGKGSPPSDLGLPNGSLYLRSDGGGGTTLYVREAGAWVAK